MKKLTSGVDIAKLHEIEREDEYDPLVVVLRIGEAIKERGLTQKKVAEMTRIRPAAISQLARGFVDRLNLDHIARIAYALNIEDIRELLYLESESEVANLGNQLERSRLIKQLDDED